MPVRLHHIVIDAHDLPGLARFWAQALGWKVLSERENEIVIGTDENAPVGMCFMPVTDPKTLKNRVHLDLTSSAGTAIIGQSSFISPAGHLVPMETPSKTLPTRARMYISSVARTCAQSPGRKKRVRSRLVTIQFPALSALRCSIASHGHRTGWASRLCARVEIVRASAT
jgi:Glyoxalase-like domain